MKTTISVEGIEIRQSGDEVELGAAVRGLCGGEDRRLWFRFPESLAESVTPTADPFLAALLPSALACGRPLVVEGEVSWRLLEQVGQQMEIWCWQNPFWNPVSVEASPWQGRFDSQVTAAFFSGGVDSFYTLLKNHDLERGQNRISHLLLVHGFDLEAANEEMFAQVAGRLAEVAAQVGVRLLEVRTNIRDISDRFVDWHFQQMGAGLAAVGLALGPFLRRVLISSGETMPTSLVAHSNPLSDPLWSTDSTDFIHDGCEATRLDRMRWRLAQSDLALSHLRVCHANYRSGSPLLWNCGRCPKCVRTMVLLEAADLLERCSAFEGLPLELGAVRGMSPDPRYHLRFIEEARATLEREGRAPELQAALRVVLGPSRRLAGSAQLHLKRCLRRVMGRRGLLLWRQWCLRKRTSLPGRGVIEHAVPAARIPTTRGVRGHAVAKNERRKVKGHQPRAKRAIRVEGIEIRQTGGQVELAGSVRGLSRGEDRRLWFRFPESLAESVTTTADPFLAALLPAALACGRPLVVDGKVSWRLLEQVDQVMEIWCRQNPVWRPIRVEASPWRGRHDSRHTGAFFSGGLDSFYTLLKNHDLERDRNRISHLLLVLGFDLECANEETYAPVAGRLARVAAEVGARLLEIRTNMRDISDRYVGWQYQQMGAGLASVGLALGPMLRRVLIPSGDTTLVSLLSPTNTLIDPLWSTDSTEFIHDGCEATRLDRIRWQLARSELALGHLRVCHANRRRGSPPLWNCGRCPKCVWTMVLLQAAGVLDSCAAFEGRPIEPDVVRRLRPDPRYQHRSLQAALLLLEREGRAPELQAALRVALGTSRRLAGWARTYLRRGLQRVMGRRGLMLRRRWRLRAR